MGYPYATEQNVYGVPGEKLALTAEVQGRDSNWNTVAVKNATFKWSASSKLKAKASGNKLTMKKLPKVGKYSVKVTAYDESGKKLAAASFKIIVKKKPGTKVVMRVNAGKGFNPSSKAEVNQSVLFDLNNAYWGWNNNKKKSFYALTVKNLDTGKTAKWNAKMGTFKKNDFVVGDATSGAGTPAVVGKFSQAGTYQITATIYHSDKVIEKAKKTVTVS